MTPRLTPATASGIEAAAAALGAGGLVAFPTETVYGLGADARRADAVARVFQVKGRPPDHPLIVHVASADHLDRWAAVVPATAAALAEAFWPGPLTLVLARAEGVGAAAAGGRATIALRVPGHPVALALLEAFGGGVAAPSANRFGEVSPTSAAHVVSDLGDLLDPERDVVLDGGPCDVGVESTIVDLTGEVPTVVRPGGITIDALAEVLGVEVVRWSGEGPATAPGMLASHYSPRARVVVVEDAAEVASVLAGLRAERGPDERLGVLAPVALDGLPVDVVELEPAGGPDGFAHVVYDRLRQADRLGVAALVVVPPPPTGVGVAVRDRLARAAAGS